MKTNTNLSGFAGFSAKSVNIGLCALLTIASVQHSFAGNSGNVAGDGKGKLEASISFGTPLSAAKNPPPLGVSSTYNVSFPKSGVFDIKPSFFPTATTDPTRGTVVTALPTTSTPDSVYCTYTTEFLLGGYKAVKRTSVTGGAIADNHDLQILLPDLAKPECAEYLIDSEFIGEKAPGLAELFLQGFGTTGVAVRFQAYEYEYDPEESWVCPEDTSTPPEGSTPGPCKEQIIQFGSKKLDILLIGPFDLTAECGWRIPISHSGNPANVYIISDALAQSSAFEISCPSGPFTFGCEEAVVYPVPTITGGCKTATVVYDPPANQLPIGTTVVTATATDEDGNEAKCDFTVIRGGGAIEFHGFYPPIDGTGGSCDSPIRVITAGNKIPIKFDATICGEPYLPSDPPNIIITKCDGVTPPIVGEFQQVANVWHFNWSTKKSDKGKYSIKVDFGPEAFVQLK